MPFEEWVDAGTPDVHQISVGASSRADPLLCCSKGHIYTPTSRHSRCPTCAPARNQERMRSPRHRIYSTKQWQKVRAIIRAHYDNHCAYQDDNCSGGLEVHHIVPTRYDSTQFFELSNLELSAGFIMRCENEKPRKPTSRCLTCERRAP